MRKICTLGLLMQIMLSSGQPNYPSEVSEAQLVFSDLENFSECLSKLTIDCDTISLLNHYYFDRASAGLKEYISRHSLSDSMLLAAMTKYPDRYQLVGDVINQRSALEQRYRNELRFYQRIVEDAVFPPTYLLVGANRGIGQGSREGQLVTMLKVADDPDKLFSMIIHELSHFQQARTMGFQAYGAIFQKPDNMLDLILREGVADFLTYGVGRQHAGDYHRLDYLNMHEEELVDRFVHDLKNQDQSYWLWESLNSTSGEPSLLGYAMGFKICSSYYQKNADKSAAIMDMLRMEDPALFLDRSKYLQGFYP